MPRRIRLQSFFLTLTMMVGIVLSAAPAQAALVRGTASVDVREVVAGAQKAFTFTVTNGGAAGNPVKAADSPINYVRIGAPSLDDTFTISNGVGEFGPGQTQQWQFDPQAGDAVFTAVNGYSLAPGESDTFTITATSASRAEDFTDPLEPWIVQVSADGGTNMLRQAASSPGALNTAIRVLEVGSAAFTSPTGILDGTATVGQNNVTITTPVSNHGTAPLSVTPSLSVPAGDSISSVSPQSTTIQPGTTEDFVYTLTVGSAANRQYTADASASNADAIEAVSDPLSTEAASVFAYVNNSLTPTASPSNLSQTFRLSLNKTQAPSVTFDSATLTFTKDGNTFSTSSLTTLPTTGRGSQGVGLEFAPLTIPTTAPDGSYTPSLTLHGTDDNGAEVSRTVSIGNAFEIDNSVPYLVPTLSAPSDQLTPEGKPVVKDGDTLTIGGQAFTSSQSNTPDSGITIDSCRLIVTDANSAPVRTIPISGCSNTAGTLSGTASEDLGVPSGFVAVEMVGHDRAGNVSVCCVSDPPLRIDNLAPEVETAITGCGAEGFAIDSACTDASTIRVELTEPVKGQFLPTDFSVDDNTVTNVEARNSQNPTAPCTNVTGGVEPGEGPTDIPTVTPPGTEVLFCDVVVLTLSDEIDEDATPGVAYEFTGLPVVAQPQDGAKNGILNGSVDAEDGIVPDLPTLAAVSQSGLSDSSGVVENFKSAQGGSFYTNENAPTFRIDNLGVGYTGIVALDTNRNGDYDEGTDTVLASCESAGTSVDCLGSGLTSTGATTILVTALDPDGNLAEGKSDATLLGKHARPETLVLDQSAPTAASFVNDVATRSITVTFSEELANDGRNAAADWKAYVLKGSRTVKLSTTSASGTDLTRTVTIDSTDPNWGATGADIIKYFYEGSVSKRYQDRAGNYLADFTLP